VPLAFTVAAVLVAYVLVHRLPWPGRWTAAIAGLTSAVGTLLVPAMLERNDLKQYTADATFALLVLATTARVERHWSRRNLALLLVAVVGGMLFSHPAAFVGAAAYLCLVATSMVRRQWQRAAEASVAALLAVIGMIAIYVGFDRQAVVPGLVKSWQSNYLPHDPRAALSFLHVQWSAEQRFVGLGPWWLAAPLFVAGVVTVMRLGRAATGATPAVLLVEMVVLSALHKYPFLEVRTGTFLFVVVVVTAAVGLVGIAVALRRRARRGGAVLAVIVVAGGLVAFAANGARFARGDTVPDEDARQQTYFVAHHMAAGDVVLVNGPSAAGFAYYWPDGGRVGRLRTDENYQRYLAVFPDRPDLLVTDGRDAQAVTKSLAAATAELRRLAPAHPGGRIWLVRTHLNPAETLAWQQALQADRLVAVATGPAGLAVLGPPT
jgi:hypothetical protein